ncbi:MAG: AbiV family abortive infection protein [Phycisphaeraceae bacterium]
MINKEYQEVTASKIDWGSRGRRFKSYRPDSKALRRKPEGFVISARVAASTEIRGAGQNRIPENMTPRLPQYRSILDARQIADGINAALKNARRLAEDSKILLDNHRFPTAASVAALSIEESGKTAILRHLASATDDKTAKPIWKEYRSHKAKNRMWILPELVAKGARRLQDFASLFEHAADHPELLDQVKQLGFYTDCLGEAHWSTPPGVVDESLARKLVETATIMATGREVTVSEIKLWVKHVGPHLNGKQLKAEAGLKRWYEEMQHLGLYPAGENAMRAFIEGGGIQSQRDDAEPPAAVDPRRDRD